MSDALLFARHCARVDGDARRAEFLTTLGIAVGCCVHAAAQALRWFTEGLLTKILNAKVILGLIWLTLYEWFISRMSRKLERSSVPMKLETTAGALRIGLGARLAVELR